MKTLIFCFLTFFSFTIYSQNCFRFQKYPIGNSGCFTYFGTQPDSVDVSIMDDGSTIYSTQTVCNNITFGILLVQFGKLNTEESKWDDLLITYMDVVKEMVGVKKSVGYGKGHTHIENKTAHGIIDFCEDEKSNEFSFKGWIDSKFAAILYISYPQSSESSIPYSPRELFLNGFRFKQ